MFGKQRDECGNARLFICGGGVGEIFYGHSVVGGVLNCIGLIYGARTHSACRYNAYICINNFKNKTII